ncbi:MAG: hypothetical protein DHS20C14_12940 [Phycisphaeraceae bacterium]|nr:MAG: hypothetical protein DHS20C14_12940 [Phycisphaeraceae bacterium]
MITLADIADYMPMIKRPAPKFISESGARIYGVVAEFADPPAVYHAAEKFRDAGYTKWDVYSPFPVHGIEEAMGIKRTILPVAAFGAAMTGVAGALLMQYFMNDWDYQFIVQGKPTSAWEPFIPITFEMGVLATAFTCIGGMLMLNGLPRWHHPLFNSERFLKVSDDRLIIAVEAADPKFDPDATRRLLEETGGTHIELIEDED